MKTRSEGRSGMMDEGREDDEKKSDEERKNEDD